MELIRTIRDQGYTVLLIEHDMGLVMGVTDRIVVLDFGKKIAEGLPAEIQRQPGGHRGLPGSRRQMLLEVEDLVRQLRAHRGDQGTSRFDVDEGEVVTLIGANGAGKTTTLKTISGLRPVRAGTIRFDGQDITTMPAARAGRRSGIGQSPEGRGIFPGMTVLENLDMGAYARKDRKTPTTKEDLDRVFELFPRLRGAAQPGRRHDVRRRAADARHRPGADGRPEAAAARRAVDGPGAEADPADLRRSSPRSTSRAPRSCSSSRTPPRRSSAPTAPTCSRPARSCATGTGAGARRRPRGQGGLPRRRRLVEPPVCRPAGIPRTAPRSHRGAVRTCGIG